MPTFHCDVAIAGASFAGISAYLMLKKRHPDLDVKLFDFRQKFTYAPGLHEAVGNTDRLKSMQFDLKKVYGEDFVRAKVKEIQKQHYLLLEDGSKWHFSYAVIATGSCVNMYGKKDFEKHAYTVRRAEDIPKLNAALKKAKTVTVIGGGFTGVEVASIIAERKKHAQVRLIHSKDQLFDRFGNSVGKLSYSYLQKQGVSIILNDKIAAMTEKSIILNSGKELSSDVTIIATGVKINDDAHKNNLTFENDYVSLESDNIRMCGDVAIHGLYTTAHNAFLEGRRIGAIISDKIEGVEKTYKPLVNYDKLAIALGTKDGIFVIGNKGYYVPYIIGILKWIIEKKVLFEFKNKIMLPI